VAGIALAFCCYWREKPAPQLELQAEPRLMALEERLNRTLIPGYATGDLTVAEAVA
jgi:hypothetical protein